MSSAELKRKILRLLREDEEFRHALLGMAGYGELLKRLEEHDRKFNEVTVILLEHGRRLDGQENVLTELVAEMGSMRAGLEAVSNTLQRLTIIGEEEGASHIRHWLKGVFGFEVEIDRV